MSKNIISKLAWIDARIELDILHPIFLKSVADEIPIREGSRVIDIGCGMGWACRHIARRYENAEVVGIDLSEDAILKARKLNSKYGFKNIFYAVASSESIPFPDNYFDYAMAFVSFSWWKNIDKSMSEIRRVLNHGGKFYLLDIYRGGLGGIFAKVSNALLTSKEKIYSVDDYRKFMEKAFSEVWQKKVKPFRWGVLTVGKKVD